MTVERDDLLALSDYVWQRLLDRIDGLGDREYLWEPVAGAWSIRPDADGIWQADSATSPADPDPFTTLAWRICHIADDLLAAERNATWVGLSIEPPAAQSGKAATAAAARARMQESYAFWRRCLAGATDLDTPIGPIAGPYGKDSRRSFILHELDELIHHGAEVGVLRDLYRATTSP